MPRTYEGTAAQAIDNPTFLDPGKKSKSKKKPLLKVQKAQSQNLFDEASIFDLERELIVFLPHHDHDHGPSIGVSSEDAALNDLYLEMEIERSVLFNSGEIED